MIIQKLSVKTNAVIPLMAALPYGVALEPPDEGDVSYDAKAQRTVYAGRNFCTCREDESVGGIISPSRADTKKDD